MTSNPLIKYMKENKLSWRQFAHASGLPLATAWRIGHDDLRALSKVTFGTHVRLRATTGIDLYKYFESHVKVELIQR